MENSIFRSPEPGIGLKNRKTEKTKKSKKTDLSPSLGAVFHGEFDFRDAGKEKPRKTYENEGKLFFDFIYPPPCLPRLEYVGSTHPPCFV